MKICYTCKIKKPFNDFYKDRKIKDGFDSSCKICRSKNRKKFEETKNITEVLFKRGKKICSVCKIAKLLEDFHNNKASKDGKSSFCKKCAREKTKNYRIENREKCLDSCKKWYEKNKKQVQEYRKLNSNKIKRAWKEYSLKTGRSTGRAETIPEKRIKEFLEQNQINFEQEKIFEECRNIKNQLLSFDFFLPDHNLLIEYNGPFHYRAVFGQEKFERQQQNDQIKVEFCKAQNIELLILKDNNFEPLYKFFEKS